MPKKEDIKDMDALVKELSAQVSTLSQKKKHLDDYNVLLNSENEGLIKKGQDLDSKNSKAEEDLKALKVKYKEAIKANEARLLAMSKE